MWAAVCLSIGIGLALSACSEVPHPDDPREHVEALREAFVARETTLVSEERLQLRYARALDYVRTYQGLPRSRGDECLALMGDTLRREPLRLRVASRPLSTRWAALPELLGVGLRARWACDAYGEPPVAAGIGQGTVFWAADTVRPSVHRPTEALSHLTSNVDSAASTLSAWQAQRTPELSVRIARLLRDLPSDSMAERAVLFEMPTRRTVTVQLPALLKAPANMEARPESGQIDLGTAWDSLHARPADILVNALTAEVVVLLFDEEDEIEEAWWGEWWHEFGH